MINIFQQDMSWINWDFFLPGYGTLPNVISSYKSTPKDHTSDLMLNLRSNAASGEVHLMGNFVSK